MAPRLIFPSSSSVSASSGHAPGIKDGKSPKVQVLWPGRHEATETVEGAQQATVQHSTTSNIVPFNFGMHHLWRNQSRRFTLAQCAARGSGEVSLLFVVS
jgi:hypothetical protein